MRNGADLKKALRSGGTCLGLWVTLTDPLVPEVMSHIGFDFLLVDLEHVPIPLDTLQTMILMMRDGVSTPIVRVPSNDRVTIKQVLDLGAEGILVPMVCSAREAREAVAASKYPPVGIRGWGPRAASGFFRDARHYAEHANERTVVIAQIEHVDAVDKLQEILSVPGLDGLFIGPADLSFSMGIPLQRDSAVLNDTIKQIVRMACESDVPVGAGVHDLEEAALWTKWGMRFLTLGTDWQLMDRSARELLAASQRMMMVVAKTG